MIKKITMSFNKEEIESIIKELNVRISQLKKERSELIENNETGVAYFLLNKIQKMEDIVVRLENYLYKY